MKKLFYFFGFILLANTLNAQFAGGSGTSGDPYQIATAADLNNIRNGYLSTGIYYVQTADINLSTYSGGAGWNAILVFRGNYDGRGFKITGLTITNGGDYYGLFGAINGATLIDVHIQGAAINCPNRNRVGGLVGEAKYSIISGCSYTGTVSGYNAIGGLVGWSESCTVTNSFSSATITCNGYSGVLIGTINKTNNISNNISNCYSTGGITGTQYCGGLFGDGYMVTMSNCYSTSNVSASSYSGGFMGHHYPAGSSISYCYSTGIVTSPGSINGGFAGSNEGTISNCFWDNQTSGFSTTGVGSGSQTGATGKSTADMKISTTFSDAGWDFNVWNIGDGINNGYPYLKWQNPGGTPLPVELTSFTATVNNVGTRRGVFLQWQTATEVNNYGFEVERSEVGSQKSEWINIGFVQGNGNSNSPKEYSFVDENPPSGNLKYRLKQIDTDGQYEYYGTIAEVNLSPTGVEGVNLPNEFKLSQNYPNPFNPVTVINYQIPVSSNVELKVYDILGNEIAVLVNEMKAAGYYEIKFDGSNLSSGIYFYKLQSSSFSEIKKFILMK